MPFAVLAAIGFGCSSPGDDDPAPDGLAQLTIQPGAEPAACAALGIDAALPGPNPPGAQVRDFAAWGDATDYVGLPRLKSRSASMRDINGDGWADLLVAAESRSTRVTSDGAEEPFAAPELYLNCGGSFVAIGLAGRVDGGPALDQATTSHIADLDGDGRPDLLLAGFGTLQILRNIGGLRFQATDFDLHGTYGGVALGADAQATSIGVFDLNGNGRLDIYVANLALSHQDGWDQMVAPDVVFTQRTDGGFDNVTEQLPAVVRTCSGGLTMALSYVTRTPHGLPPLLYLGVDMARDCLFELHRDGSALPSFVELQLPAYGMCQTTATMGVDHLLLPDTGDAVIAISDVGKVPVYRVSDTGKVVDLTDDVTYGAETRVGWGVAAFDAELDGTEDLTIAYGYYSVPPFGQVEGGQDGNPPGPVFLLNSLRYYRGVYQGAGALEFIDRSVTAGAHFTPGLGGSDDLEQVLLGVTSAEDVEALRQDWFGATEVDANLDGCPDLLATPFAQLDADCSKGACFNEDPAADGELSWRYASRATVTLLQNACDYGRHWIGFRMPMEPGAIVELEVDSGAGPVTRYRQVKAAPGVAGIGDVEVLRFGLGEGTPTVTRAYVWWDDGTKTELPPATLTVDAYNAVVRP